MEVDCWVTHCRVQQQLRKNQHTPFFPVYTSFCVWMDIVCCFAVAAAAAVIVKDRKKLVRLWVGSVKPAVLSHPTYP